jgi:hypothetical protein
VEEPVLLCFALALGFGEGFVSVLRVENFLTLEQILDREDLHARVVWRIASRAMRTTAASEGRSLEYA